MSQRHVKRIAKLRDDFAVEIADLEGRLRHLRKADKALAELEGALHQGSSSGTGSSHVPAASGGVVQLTTADRLRMALDAGEPGQRWTTAELADAIGGTPTNTVRTALGRMRARGEVTRLGDHWIATPAEG